MPTYQTTPHFEHELPESTFLSDPRVVEYPRLLWWLILNLVILVIRPPRSAAAYRKVWTDQGSPLLLHSRAIANKLRDRLSTADAPIHVELAMTYGEPSINNAIDNLLAKGARRIVTLPLYPQYSGTTTASVFDVVARKLNRLRWIPEMRFINDYHDTPGYIGALAASIRESWDANGRGDKLLMSFHGVPESTLLNGDPYHGQCQKTARALANKLELCDDEWMIAFQSRVGREKWLAPYTDQTVRELGAAGLSRIDVVCPGFSADCLETLEEIAMQNADFFRNAGGGSLHYIPALNARDDHVLFLSDLIRQHTANWTSQADSSSPQESSERTQATGTAS